GAATVGAGGQCPHAGGHGRGGTPAGTTRGGGQVPRITGDAGQRAVGDTLPGQFRGGGLADEDSTLLAQTCGHRGILVPRGVLGSGDRTTKGRPTTGQMDVLDRGGYTVEPAHRFAAPQAFGRGTGGLSGFLRTHEAVRVECGVVLLDAFQDRFHGLHRGKLPGGVAVQKLFGTHVGRKCRAAPACGRNVGGTGGIADRTHVRVLALCPVGTDRHFGLPVSYRGSVSAGHVTAALVDDIAQLPPVEVPGEVVQEQI